MFAKLCAVRANRGNRNKKGFTLAELLIVVAIIGVLVAIAIPVFTSSLSKAEEAVSDANFRSAKAVAAVQVLKDVADGKNISTVTYEYKVDENKDISLKPAASEYAGNNKATSTTTGFVTITEAEVK